MCQWNRPLLVQIKAHRLFGAKNHYLNQYWLFNMSIENPIYWNSNQNAVPIQDNGKMSLATSRLQRVSLEFGIVKSLLFRIYLILLTIPMQSVRQSVWTMALECSIQMWAIKRAFLVKLRVLTIIRSPEAQGVWNMPEWNYGSSCNTFISLCVNYNKQIKNQGTN